MIIYVQTAPDETIRFQVMSNDTAEDLKNKIQNKMAIPPEEQSHIFAGKVLLQGRTLSDDNIQNNYTLLLVTKLGQPITRSVQLETEASGKIKIICYTHVGRKISFEVEMSETIRDLKERLYAATTIPVDYQALIHNCRRLKDEKTLFDYNIKGEDTIHQTVPFKAKLEGSRFESSHIHLYQKSGARRKGESLP